MKICENGIIRDMTEEEVAQQNAVLDAEIDSFKDAMIAESKTALSEYLATHPMRWRDGRYYSVTFEKQSLLTSQLALYVTATQTGIPYELRWNSTGDECTQWEYADLCALAFDIGAYVNQLVSRQQAYEVAIKGAKTMREIENIRFVLE